MQTLAREKSPGMIEILSEIAHNAKSHPQATVGVAREVLDRGYGHPNTHAGELRHQAR
jgi:hypothetical protein